MGLSLDGSAQLHNLNRKDAKNRGTFSRVMQSKALLEKHKIPYNILTALTNNAAHYPGQMWSFLVKEGIDYVQFIPCLDELGDQEKTPYSLTPQRFYSFYATLFPLWAKLLREGRYISIKLFDDLVNFYLKGIPTACGINGQCAVQFVVEGDGSVFPCDFYMLDEFYMGNIADSTPGALFQKGQSFVASGGGYERDAPCAGCKYLNSCGGGCKRMRDVMYVSGGVCYYAKLLDEILPPLIQIGRALSQQ